MTDLGWYEELKAPYRANGEYMPRDPIAGLADTVCEHAERHPIHEIPPRRWAYGTFLLFGAASVIGAVDGGGKGALATVIVKHLRRRRACTLGDAGQRPLSQKFT